MADQLNANSESHNNPFQTNSITAPPMTDSTFTDEASDTISHQHQPPPPIDESRKLFQRLWTDEDEIELLKGFLEYTNQRGQGQHNSYDTNLFYDQIRSKLQLEFNKNQLVEKLRRLKKKYRNVVKRISAGKDVAFKSSHDQATFEISCKIWGNDPNVVNALDDEEANFNVNASPNPNAGYDNVTGEERSSVKSRKRLRARVEEQRDYLDVGGVLPNCEGVLGGSLRQSTNIPSVIEETVRSCLTPRFKEIMDTAVNGYCRVGGIEVMSKLLLGYGNVMGGGVNMGERWRRQQILELEVYSRRLELVQDEIMLQLHELRSSES